MHRLSTRELLGGLSAVQLVWFDVTLLRVENRQGYRLRDIYERYLYAHACSHGFRRAINYVRHQSYSLIQRNQGDDIGYGAFIDLLWNRVTDHNPAEDHATARRVLPLAFGGLAHRTKASRRGAKCLALGAALNDEAALLARLPKWCTFGIRYGQRT